MIKLTKLLQDATSKSDNDDVGCTGEDEDEDENDDDLYPTTDVEACHLPAEDKRNLSVACLDASADTTNLSAGVEAFRLNGQRTDATGIPLLYVRFRTIQPNDRAVIQQLHEQWFPVKYVDEFFDDLCNHGRMTGSGNPLFSSVAITMNGNATTSVNGTTTDYRGHYSDEPIVACVVGCFLKAVLLSGKTQKLLVNDIQRHPRLFYIMTVGTVTRQIGLGARMIQHCIEQVQGDTGCGVLYLHVLTDNIAAIRMYENLGFYRAQEIPSYYNIDGVLHSCYLYAMYFHGNRGHRALYNLVQSTWISIWERVKSASTLWGGKVDTTGIDTGFNRKKHDTKRSEYADNDDGYDCENHARDDFETVQTARYTPTMP